MKSHTKKRGAVEFLGRLRFLSGHDVFPPAQFLFALLRCGTPSFLKNISVLIDNALL
ncbi:hypothetical protein HMPREF7215_2168 [Pyramidobacter piscolens W5455]|uniref:Uncharacterized protein n=1 Tax=Pyramidobacter piscolens W5455 TaxID=352165 RepID=A0ABM9ZWN5_9BACT|nr:hypothetical protein HMPREF7215_2168 [Pyramidobacter piscolens W5455]